MVHYIIEGGYDFYKELQNSISKEEDESLLKETTNSAINSSLCLITNESLTENYITMKCGHKFNYLPLYKYLINYKQKFNYMENTKDKLEINEIRCPYCRHRQKTLLPYYDNIKGVRKINGVNNEYIKQQISYDKACCFNLPESNQLCGKYYTFPLSEPYIKENTQYYCYLHQKKIIQKYEKDAKMKEKELLKKQKLEEKEKKIQVKLKEKQELQEKKKLEKQLKLDLKKSKEVNTDEINMDENVVLEMIPIQCQVIVKTGINKGKHCSFSFYQDGLCKRHYQINMKGQMIKDETNVTSVFIPVKI